MQQVLRPARAMQRYLPHTVWTFQPAMAEVGRGLDCAGKTAAWIKRTAAIGRESG